MKSLHCCCLLRWVGDLMPIVQMSKPKFCLLEELAQGHRSTLCWKRWHLALCHLGCCVGLILEASLVSQPGQ